MGHIGVGVTAMLVVVEEEEDIQTQILLAHHNKGLCHMNDRGQQISLRMEMEVMERNQLHQHLVLMMEQLLQTHTGQSEAVVIVLKLDNRIVIRRRCNLLICYRVWDQFPCITENLINTTMLFL